MTEQKTTHDVIAETLTQPYTEPSKDAPETTHDAQMSRYIERFHVDPFIRELVDVLSNANEEKREAVRRALRGE